MVKLASKSGNIVLDMKSWDFGVIRDWPFHTKTEKSFSGLYAEFRGTGFKYDADGVPTSGTVTSFSPIRYMNKQWTISEMSVKMKALVDVAMTKGKADDQALIKKIFSGNDTLNGGHQNDVLYGYGGKDTLNGGMSDDKLYGGTGADTLNGGDGNDRLYGESGSDKLHGGLGADKLYGGTGADTFIFKSIWESRSTKDAPASSFRDTIYDFSHKQKDKIDLKAIDANTTKSGDQAFKFIGKEKFHKKAGELRYEQKSGDTFIHGDVNGDGKADFSVKFDDSIAFVKGDFIL